MPPTSPFAHLTEAMTMASVKSPKTKVKRAAGRAVKGKPKGAILHVMADAVGKTPLAAAAMEVALTMGGAPKAATVKATPAPAAPAPVSVAPKAAPVAVEPSELSSPAGTVPGADQFLLLDPCPRNVLSEGRSYGLGFALCRRRTDTEHPTLETVQPISPCKDYLNDVVYSEHSGKPYNAYGLSTSFKGILKEECAYMVIAVCLQGARSSSRYPAYDGEVKWMKAHHVGKLQAFINWMESLIVGLPATARTVIAPIAGCENRYSVSMPIWWTSRTYLISLMSLLLRASLEGDAGPLASIEALKEMDTTDSSYFTSLFTKIAAIVGGSLPQQAWSSSTYWHNCGLSGTAVFNTPAGKD